MRIRLEFVVFIKDATFSGQLCLLVSHELAVAKPTVEPANGQVRGDDAVARDRVRCKWIDTQCLSDCSWMRMERITDGFIRGYLAPRDL